MHGIAPRFYTGLESTERVEVLKGPAALLYGMSPNGTVGGNVNLVTKRSKAQDKPNSLAFSFGDGHQFGQNLDVSKRTDDNKFGIRINAYHSNGSTLVTDEKTTSNSLFIGTDYKTDKSNLTLDFGYVYHDIDNMQYRVQFGNNYLAMRGVPTADNNKKYGAPGTYRHITERYGMLRYDYDFSDNLSAYLAAGMRITKMEYIYNNFRLNANGTTSLRYNVNDQINKANTEEAGLKSKFVTSGWQHEMTLAATRYGMKRYMANRSGSYFLMTSGWGTNTLDRTFQTPLNDTTTLSGVALTDVITSPDEDWIFIVGGRYQQVKQNAFATPFSSTQSSYKSHAWTPAFGIVKKLNSTTSLYTNYIEGLTAGTVVDGGYLNDGEVLAPYKAKQYEIGAKFDLGKIFATVGAFQIKRNGTMEVGNYLTDAGEVRNRGLELSVAGEPSDGTRIWSSLMYLKATYEKDAAYQGNIVRGTPRWQTVIGAEQDIKGVKGLSVNTRLNYSGSAYVDQNNLYKIPQWLTWDIGSRYEFNWNNMPMILRADVYNVLDKSYWTAQSNADALYVSKGRTMMVSLEMQF